MTMIMQETNFHPVNKKIRKKIRLEQKRTQQFEQKHDSDYQN